MILVLNKADKVPDRSRLEELAKAFYQEYPFKKCFLVSALRGGGMQYLKEYLVRKVMKLVTINLPASGILSLTRSALFVSSLKHKNESLHW